MVSFGIIRPGLPVGEQSEASSTHSRVPSSSSAIWLYSLSLPGLWRPRFIPPSHPDAGLLYGLLWDEVHGDDTNPSEAHQHGVRDSLAAFKSPKCLHFATFDKTGNLWKALSLTVTNDGMASSSITTFWCPSRDLPFKRMLFDQAQLRTAPKKSTMSLLSTPSERVASRAVLIQGGLAKTHRRTKGIRKPRWAGRGNVLGFSFLTWSKALPVLFDAMHKWTI